MIRHERYATAARDEDRVPVSGDGDAGSEISDQDAHERICGGFQGCRGEGGRGICAALEPERAFARIWSALTSDESDAHASGQPPSSRAAAATTGSPRCLETPSAYRACAKPRMVRDELRSGRVPSFS